MTTGVAAADGKHGAGAGCDAGGAYTGNAGGAYTGDAGGASAGDAGDASAGNDDGDAADTNRLATFLLDNTEFMNPVIIGCGILANSDGLDDKFRINWATNDG